MNTINEFVPIAKALKGLYPQPTFMAGEEVVQIWFELLKDFDYMTVHNAAMRYMSTYSQPPYPADLIRLCVQTITPAELEEAEAWSMVWKAIQRGSQHALEDFEAFPPEIQKAVGCADQLRTWAIDENFNEAVTSSNFKRSYRQVLERKRNDAVIPFAIRQSYETIRAQAIATDLSEKLQMRSQISCQ